MFIHPNTPKQPRKVSYAPKKTNERYPHTLFPYIIQNNQVFLHRYETLSSREYECCWIGTNLLFGNDLNV